jgi:CheY-like chemotaxis protein
MKSVSVLIADDSATFRQLLCMGLARIEGIDKLSVTEARDGEEALDKLKAETFSLLITDIRMPRVDGLELVRRTRRDLGLEAIPILIVSTKGEEDDIAKGLELGANGYLSKPLSMSRLKEVVASFLLKG